MNLDSLVLTVLDEDLPAWHSGTRLVLADWLEETGDGRADVVRQLPIPGGLLRLPLEEGCELRGWTIVPEMVTTILSEIATFQIRRGRDVLFDQSLCSLAGSSVNLGAQPITVGAEPLYLYVNAQPGTALRVALSAWLEDGTPVVLSEQATSERLTIGYRQAILDLFPEVEPPADHVPAMMSVPIPLEMPATVAQEEVVQTLAADDHRRDRLFALYWLLVGSVAVLLVALDIVWLLATGKRLLGE